MPQKLSEPKAKEYCFRRLLRAEPCATVEVRNNIEKSLIKFHEIRARRRREWGGGTTLLLSSSGISPIQLKPKWLISLPVHKNPIYLQTIGKQIKVCFEIKFDICVKFSNYKVLFSSPWLGNQLKLHSDYILKSISIQKVLNIHFITIGRLNGPLRHSIFTTCLDF